MNWAAGWSCATHDLAKAFAGAGRSDERPDLVGILLAGGALDAGGDVNAARAGDAQRLGDIVGIEPAREHEWYADLEVLEQPPVEALAEPARPCRIARRAGIEDQAVGQLVVEADRRQVRLLRDRQRLHDRQPEARAHHDDALRRLLA